MMVYRYGEDKTFNTDECSVSSGGTSTGTTAYARFRNLVEMGKYEEAYKIVERFPAMFKSENSPYNICDNALFVDFMKTKDKDGLYSSYNKGVVTEVSKLQGFVNNLFKAEYFEASGPIDGIFGPLTEIGVKRLQSVLNGGRQEESKLLVDGIVGPNTRSAINNFCLPDNF
ncbi:MAG: peptidoglycan-binding domain-containing protein [Candidatus Paceibacterota bacterium]